MFLGSAKLLTAVGRVGLPTMHVDWKFTVRTALEVGMALSTRLFLVLASM